MVKRILFLNLLVLISISFTQAQQSVWLTAIGNTETLNDVATDQNGFIYITGNIISIDSLFGSREPDSIGILGKSYVSPNFSSGNYSSAYLAKIDSTGDLKWARIFAQKLSGNHEVNSRHLVIDGNGDVVVNMLFGDTLLIENDTTVVRNSLAVGAHSCIAKFDNTGNFKWARRVPGREYVLGTNNYGLRDSRSSNGNIVVDNSNNIYIRTNDFPTLPSATSHVHKYSATGNLISSTQMAGAGGYTNDIAIDNSGYMYTNYFKNVGSSDTLLVQYSPTGSIQSVLRASSIGGTLFRLIHKGAYLYAVGTFFSFNSFTIGGKTIYNNGMGNNLFVMKYEPFSKTVVWLKNVGCQVHIPSFVSSSDLKVNDMNEVYFTGMFKSSFCLDGRTYVTQLPDSTNAFLIKLDDNGNLEWAKNIENNSTDVPPSSIALAGHNVYMGLFSRFGTVFSDVHSASNGNGYLYRVFDGANEISGKVYYDQNNSGSPDPGDIFIQDQIVNLVGNYATITKSNGEYNFYPLKGNFTFEPVNAPYIFSYNPASHSASFSGINQVDTGNHFKAVLIPNIDDLQIFITPNSTFARKAVNSTYVTIDYKNVGSTTISDTLIYTFDEDLIVDSIYPAPTSTSAGKIKWTFSGFGPFQSDQNYVRFKLDSVNMGDTLWHHVSIYPIATDSVPSDNMDSISQRVIAAYDPNDKQVKPEGDVSPEYCDDGNYFTYTIRFQNTGTDTAFLVRIRDTISGKLNIQTFEMLAASHDYEIELTDNKVLDFIFDQIMLPDSNVNEEQSHGFVKFRIKTIKGLIHGDYFENTAHIYFDNNEAIVTNTTHTEVSDWAGLKSYDRDEAKMLIYPNPNDGNFIIKIDDDLLSESRIVIRDVMGRSVYTDNSVRFDRGKTILTLDQIERGIYIVEVQTENKKYSKRIIIQ